MSELMWPYMSPHRNCLPCSTAVPVIRWPLRKTPAIRAQKGRLSRAIAAGDCQALPLFDAERQPLDGDVAQ